jgi:glutathione S-transferase
MAKQPYILYGAYASYYTAKVRSYLRKKGIPFQERLPSDPLFRSLVRPTSGSHRIPQLLTPQQAVIQDSIAIVDALEVEFPEIPALPESPAQRLYVHLMELLGSEGLLSLAWRHRWLFDENLTFIKRDFGRSFEPQGDDQALMKYGQLIADRMTSYGLPPTTPDVQAELDTQYMTLIGLFENHLMSHPYLLGGHPSQADYSVMGALHAHMGRDPAGLRLLQLHGPRTFRWVEHMLTPDVQSPEFFDRPIVYPDHDEVPDSAMAILNWIASTFGEPLVLNLHAYAAACKEGSIQPGACVDEAKDQPLLAAQKINLQGAPHMHRAQIYAVWLSQRFQRHMATLSTEDKARLKDHFSLPAVAALLSAPVGHPLARRDQRFYAESIKL